MNNDFQKMMLPLGELNKVYNKKTGELNTIRYFVGDPMQTRFDGNEGRFRVGDKNWLTDQATTFTMDILGLRIFQGKPFDNYKDEEKWVEMYGLTANLAVFSILLRGGSASEFFKYVYYYGASPLDCRTTFKPIQRLNKDVGKAYWICEPSFAMHTEEEQAICDQLRDKLDNLYNARLCEPHFHEIMAANYNGCEFRIVESGVTTLKAVTDPVDFGELGNPKGVKRAA
jgi:hypothetical protein